MRTSIFGITSVAGRFDDLRNRYVPQRFTKAYLDKREAKTKQIEAAFFGNISITPEDITDASTAEIQKELLNFDIATS